MLKKIPAFLAIFVFMNSNFVSANCMRGMVSFKGATIVALIYGSATTIGNLLWAFRWSEHTSISEETSAQIQEAGGLIAATASAFLGVAVPSMIYVYQKYHHNKLLAGSQARYDEV